MHAKVTSEPWWQQTVPSVACADRDVVQTPAVPTIRITQDPTADALLSRDPLALLLGTLLDQHVSRGSGGR